jgi:hypothetical protein
LERKVLTAADILMVWQAYMLSPRNFLEDCIRFGKMYFGRRVCLGMSLMLAWRKSQATSLVMPQKNAVEERTGHEWDNLMDAPVIKLTGPKDEKILRCSWTTCDYSNTRNMDLEERLLGRGYADKDFHMPMV